MILLSGMLGPVYSAAIIVLGVGLFIAGGLGLFGRGPLKEIRRDAITALIFGPLMAVGGSFLLRYMWDTINSRI